MLIQIWWTVSPILFQFLFPRPQLFAPDSKRDVTGHISQMPFSDILLESGSFLSPDHHHHHMKQTGWGRGGGGDIVFQFVFPPHARRADFLLRWPPRCPNTYPAPSPTQSSSSYHVESLRGFLISLQTVVAKEHFINFWKPLQPWYGSRLGTWLASTSPPTHM